ncbi:metallophosphoesterase [Variovorax boronicumulans]
MATVPNLGSSAANAQSAKNRIPGVCDCSDPVDKSALILYPSLGTPLLLKEGQTKCSIFIVGESSLKAASGAGGLVPAPAPNLHVFVDRHLRLYSIKEKGTQTDTTTGTLFGDGNTCATAPQHIKAWRVGLFGAGVLIKDRHRRPFATIAPMAAQVYKDLQGGDIYEIEIDLKAAPFQGINSGSFMSFAWMVKLNDAGKQLLPNATHAEPQDLMIAKFLREQSTKDPFHFANLHEFDLSKGARTTANQLPPQKTGAGKRLQSWHPVKYMPARPLKLGHLSDVHVNVRHTAMGKSMAQVLEGDVADVKWNTPVGTKVCNSFDALRALFEKMALGGDKIEKADAVLLTGDLIDFNRNLNPAQVAAGKATGNKAIGEQWKSFNLLANIDDPATGKRLYPRGLDDMLVFSLVREMYRKYSLPIFMTSGNHEAYQVPYGISARVEAGDMANWAFKLGVLETAADPAKRSEIARAAVTGSGGALRDRAGTVVDKVSGWFKSATGVSPSEAAGRGVEGVEQVARAAEDRLGGLNEGLSKALKTARGTLDGSELAEHRKQIEAASDWTRGKANEGMSRDHNMTIYEACLAYGPTYGQALTGFNFHSGQFDWFYALFTPLADVVVAYGAQSDDDSAAGTLQVIAPMGWGSDENFKNLGELVDPAKLPHMEDFGGVDRQGAGILPRATESWSTAQFELLSQAQKYKAAGSKTSLTVASHFTIVSFDEPQPYSNVKKRLVKARLWPHNSATGLPDEPAGFNHVNVGTCERGLAHYFEHYVRAGRRRPKGGAQVDWHLSGHSHRSGVYQVEWQSDGPDTKPYIQVVSAKDPGIHEVQTVPADTQTALIVSSCGGPIGYQNLDGELSAWTGRPPAGTLLEPATGKINQVSTRRCRIEDGKAYNEKPRLCVALDYLHVMSGLPAKGNIDKPLEFGDIPQFAMGNTQIPLRLSRQMKKLNCIVSLTLWVFEGGKDSEKNDVRKWHRVDTKLDTLGSPGNATVSNEGMAALSRAFATGVVGKQADSAFRRIQATFCEVGLRKPEPMKADEDWALHMQCTDPWVFPIAVVSTNAGRTMAGLGRVGGEKGEVPDWYFLADHFPAMGYPPPLDAIRPK